MKANLLDDIFTKELKDQTKTPENIRFRKDRIYHSIETELNEKSNRKWQFAVAILILTLFSSGYWHYEQEKMIHSQSNNLYQQQNLIVSITNESEKQVATNNIMSDSLKRMRDQFDIDTKIVRLAPMPTIIINQPIVFKNTKESEHITIQYITQYKTIKKEETKLPELDLPVVYESENLANNTMETSGSSKLSKKISKLFNN